MNGGAAPVEVGLLRPGDNRGRSLLSHKYSSRFANHRKPPHAPLTPPHPWQNAFGSMIAALLTEEQPKDSYEHITQAAKRRALGKEAGRRKGHH